jgi:hypothetical protein
MGGFGVPTKWGWGEGGERRIILLVSLSPCPPPLAFAGIVEHDDFPEDTLNYRCYRGVV